MRNVQIPEGSPVKFIKESNLIEGITRPPTAREINEYIRFMRLEEITVAELQKFLSVYQPDAKLRVIEGLDVQVGNYRPPEGSVHVLHRLEDILVWANENELNWEQAFQVHVAYEKLHPFTDGNGRSGRMLWRWMLYNSKLGFLHSFYYQTLDWMGRNASS